ncbi:MAG: 4'-phosphopantetheinyl transferase superfamily protein [Clostridia bacterium]|nr:4'-phosphopantetheinyl transferase superfamily protein [Clostridia bacterium]
MRISICLLGVDELPEPREELAALAKGLPFGEEARRRLLQMKNSSALRQSLGGLLALRSLMEQRGIPSATVLRSEQGKPYFAESPTLPFGISHSQTLAVAVLGENGGGSLGVDLEFLRENCDPTRLAARFFCKTERDELTGLGNTPEAFLRLWTKKEAAAKCSGEGIVPFLGKENLSCCSDTYSVIHHGKSAYLTLCCTAKPTKVTFLCQGKGIMITNDNQ